MRKTYPRNINREQFEHIRTLSKANPVRVAVCLSRYKKSGQCNTRKSGASSRDELPDNRRTKR